MVQRTVGDDAGSVGELWEPLGQVNAIRATVTHRTRRGGGVNQTLAQYPLREVDHRVVEGERPP